MFRYAVLRMKKKKVYYQKSKNLRFFCEVLDKGSEKNSRDKKMANMAWGHDI